MRRVVARCAGNAAAGMGAGTAHVEAFHRRTIIGVAHDRTRREYLIERQRAVHDVAARETEGAFQIKRRQRHAAEHGGFESGRRAIRLSFVNFEQAIFLPDILCHYLRAFYSSSANYANKKLSIQIKKE